VEGDALRAVGGQAQPAAADQFGDELGVVHHLIVPAELRVLFGEGVVAVRAGDQDARRVDLVEHLDVGRRHLVEQVLVTGAAGGVASAAFALAQHSEPDPRRPQDVHQRPRDLLRARLEAARAAHPVEHLDLARPLDGRHVQPLRPGQTAPAHLPGIAGVLHALERAL